MMIAGFEGLTGCLHLNTHRGWYRRAQPKRDVTANRLDAGIP